MKDNAEYIGQKYYCMYCGEPDKYKPSQIEPHWTIHRNNHMKGNRMSSRELDEILDPLWWSDETHLGEARAAILAYTANKQLEARIDELQLLHKFAQTNNSVATTALAWERLQQLKNKKESLS